MNASESPLLILIVGRPASGKTTIAARLAARFNLPLLAKDDFKEILFDRLGAGHRAWSIKLGQAAFSVLDHAIEQQLRTGVPIIVEAAYNAQYENAKFQAWQQQYGYTVLQIHCVASEETLVQRFVERATSGARHAGHGDSDNVEEFRASLGDGRAETLDVAGETIEFDSTVPGATEQLLDRIEHDLSTRVRERR